MNYFYRLIFSVVFLVSYSHIAAQDSEEASKNMGIGLRLGDPSGLTFKKYFGDNALELSIGRTYVWNKSLWYNNEFDTWYKDKKYNYHSYKYNSYNATSPVGIQLHYLIHKKLEKVGETETPGLSWYYGLGGQLRYQKYYFNYYYKTDPYSPWYYESGSKVTDLDFGADGVVGLEYKIPTAPIVLFADLVLFMEIFDNPFYIVPQGGFGARYTF